MTRDSAPLDGLGPANHAMLDRSDIPLDADALRTFVAVCERGSFRAAGLAIHRSPAAVSGRIAKLEERLGRRVFEREGRRVRLNPDGEALLAYARRVLALNEEIRARFAASETRGHVRFGAPDDYGTRWLPTILKAFARTHPAVRVDVTLATSTAVRDGIEGGTLDVGLVTLGEDDGRGDVVHREPLVWAGAASGSAAFSSELPLAVAKETCAWRRAAVDACTRAGRPFRIALTSEHSAGQIAALRADLAVAPLPESAIEHGLERVPPDVLPLLPDYCVRLLVRANAGVAGRALAEGVAASVRTSGVQ